MYVFVIIVLSFFACKDGSKQNDSGISTKINDTLVTNVNYKLDTTSSNEDLVEEKAIAKTDKLEKPSSHKDEKISKEIPDTVTETNVPSEPKDFTPTEAVHPNTIDESTKENDGSTDIVKVDDSDNLKVEETVPAEKEQVKPEKFNHDLFDGLLSIHVSKTGVVNYAGFKKDEGKLDSYLSLLERTNIEKDWSNNKKLAFWINLYNASTIKLILQNYPLNSIMKLDGGKVWDREWVKQNGKTYSLNHIEHEIIRPRFMDSRIHFAVNCAAKSCPPIWNNAWTEQNISRSLDQVTRSFINNSNYNIVSSEKAVLSKIFKWYATDFGDLIEYINKYSKVKISNKTNIEYQEYDWDLNGN